MTLHGLFGVMLNRSKCHFRARAGGLVDGVQFVVGSLWFLVMNCGIMANIGRGFGNRFFGCAGFFYYFMYRLDR